MEWKVALKRKYYGINNFGSNGFCFRRNRGRSISSTRKTYKNPEEIHQKKKGILEEDFFQGFYFKIRLNPMKGLNYNQ